MEHGATRNFQAEKCIEEQEKRIQQEREEEELNNPMKVGIQTVHYCHFWLASELKIWYFPNPLSGVGEPHKGFQDGNGGSGNTPGVEGAESAAGSS